MRRLRLLCVIQVVATAGAWLAMAGCPGRAVGTSLDGAVPVDGTLPDTSLPGADSQVIDPDSGTPDPCEAAPIPLAFALDTTVTPTVHQGDIEQWDIDGMVTYLGPPTDPASSWQGELHVADPNGPVSVLHYRLPLGMVLPLVEGTPVHLTFRHAMETGIFAHAVVITRPTSGLHPLLVAADVGGMLEEEDPLTSPLRVYRVASTACPPINDRCGTQRQDALLFDPSTGGAIIQLTLEQGDSGLVPVFGEDFQVINVRAGHYESETGQCVDYLSEWVHYLAVRVEQ